jgi:Glycosyl hydrolases family 16
MPNRSIAILYLKNGSAIMTQRQSLTFGGITWYYGLAANAWAAITPGAKVVGKSGANNALYGADNDTLSGGGGGGDNYFYLGHGDQAVAGAGDGIDTITKYWGDVTLPTGFSNGVLSNPGTITGNTGNNILTVSGIGAHTLRAGMGNDVLIGSTSGSDRFLITSGAGADVVMGFQHGTDLVELDNFTAFSGAGGFAKLQQAMTQVGDNVLLDLGGGETLTFAGAVKAQFTAGDFALPMNLAGFQLTFDDEFDTFNASPDGLTTTWRTTGSTFSHELEHYSSTVGAGGPFSLANGILDIAATPVSSAAGLPYTSGEITTQRSFAQTYGYFEMRAELPAGQGMWPAFWLLPADGSWPPELDVMEMLGNDPTMIYTTTHSQVASTAALADRVADTSAGFHSYGVDWEPDRVTFYFDGNAISSLATPADMNKPMYMLVNLAVGGVGSWPGAALGESGHLLVDYVRAYASPTATPRNTPPRLTGLPANQRGTDAAPVAPFGAITVGDFDNSTAIRVDITLTSGGAATDSDGILSGPGLTKTGIGMYSLTATSPTSLGAELRALAFTATAHQVAPGRGVATSFNLTVTKGSVTNSTSTILTITAVDSGPIVTQVTPANNVENSQSVVIGSVAPGLAGDTLHLTQSGGSLGTVSLGVAGQNGVRQVLYSAPAGILATAIDSVSYSITDQHNDIAATGSANVQLERGAVVTPAGPVVLAAGQSAVVDTITAGLPGDVVTLTQTVAGLGAFSLVRTVDGGTAQPNQYNVVYTETGAFMSSRRDTATFQVTDRIGGKGVGYTPGIRLDAGATIVSSLTGVKVAPGKTVTIGSVTPGLAGDTLTITGGNGVPGTFSLGLPTASGLQKILYTAPGVVASNGAVSLSYTISDQTGANPVSGTSSAILTNPLLTITKQPATVVEKGQSTFVATVSPGSPVDTLTLTRTGTAVGTLSLVTVNDVVEIQYTAASFIASSRTDSAGYIISDGHGGSVSGVAAVTLDGGPKLSLAIPGVVVQGQSTVIGTVIPGLSGDLETLTQTGSSQGTVTLSGGKIIYTAAANVSTTGTDAVSYTITDQHQDATVSGSAAVKLLGAAPVSGSAAITSTTAGTFIDLVGGSPGISFVGANAVILLEGSASPGIIDRSRGLTVVVGSRNVSATLQNFAADGQGVIDLLHGIGGYTTAAAAQSALTSDGNGGSKLALGSGFIDIAGMAPASVAASHFKIG